MPKIVSAVLYFAQRNESENRKSNKTFAYGKYDEELQER